MPVAAAPLTGNVLSLIRWFQMPTDAGGKADDATREAILGDAYAFTAFGVHRNHVLLRTPRGRTLVEPLEQNGAKLLVFDHLPRGRAARIRFWMNAASVADLGDRLRAAPELRRPFDALFLND